MIRMEQCLLVTSGTAATLHSSLTESFLTVLSAYDRHSAQNVLLDEVFAKADIL